MARFGRLGHLASLACCCALLQTTNAAAQASASDKAAAEALFDQGVRSMKQNNFAEACSKLEESDRIDPAVGTLLYLGECYERVGKTASAWATFREAASLATTSNQGDRARVAAARAQELESKLSRLSVEVAPEVAKIPGVVVKRGTQRLEPSLYGTALPVDPGDYKIEVTAPGYEPWSTPIKVEGGGANASVRVPALVKSSEPVGGAAPAPAPANEPSPGSAQLTQPAPAADAPDRGMSTQQTIGLVTGAVGVVGLGVGSFFGIRALKKSSEADSHCPNTGFCKDEQGLLLTEEGQQQASLANIGFAVGGGLLALGAVLYLTGAPSASDRVALAPTLLPDSAGATVSGRF